MEPATHIIGKQTIRLRYSGDRDSLALRQMISQVCRDELPVRLNQLLDRYDRADTLLRIDKLDIRVTIADSSDLETSLPRAIMDGVEAALRRELELQLPRLEPAEAGFARTLRHYLEQGYFPWWSGVKDRNAFYDAFKKALTGPALNTVIREVLPALHRDHARIRFAALLDADRFDAFISAAGIWEPRTWEAWKECFRLIRAARHTGAGSAIPEAIIGNSVLAAVAGGPPQSVASQLLAARIVSALQQNRFRIGEKTVAALPLTSLQEAFRQWPDIPAPYWNTETQPVPRDAADSPSPGLRDGIQQAQAEKGPSEDTGGIRVDDAGLVLLALYLPHFFENTGLLAEGGLRDASRAVRLLRYLAFGREEAEEFELVLEKILCGLPLAQGIDDTMPLTDAEKEEAERLLESVIGHWTVLKNTTPAGLRHNFLQREGRIVLRHNQWELTVRQQAHDILLNYLPWNIGMIRLPWMPQLMVVKWNT